MPLPKLRPVEATPMKVEDRVVICVSDPEGVTEETLVLSPGAFLAASLLDGERGYTEVASGFAEAAGQELDPKDLQTLVDELDRHHLLETPSFRLRRADVRRRFSEQRVRESSHAGSAYPSDPEELKAAIKGCFGREGSPELVDAAGVSPAPRGLVAPHIDFARGGHVYAWAYRRLIEARVPDLIVVLGVAHLSPDAPLTMTRKAFETPLGEVETDPDAADALAEAGPWVSEHEYVHRREHSIEFQLVWLQTLRLPGSFRILPVLVSSYESAVGRDSPVADGRVAAGIAALTRLVRERGALLLGSVDLAHVGPRFGDPWEVGRTTGGWLKAADDRLLSRVVNGDAEGFWNEAMKDGNARRVDGVSVLYTMLKALEPCGAEMLGYGQGEDPQGGLVSFASMAFP